MRIRSVAIGLTFILASAIVAQGQATITSVQPASCKPGETTRLTLQGKGLKDRLQIVASLAASRIQMESLEAEKAVVSLTLPEDAPLGPLGLWMATSEGPVPPQVLLVDDLPTVADNGQNHSRDSAQKVATLCAIDGVSDSAHSDFYRFTVAAGERVAFEVLTQPIRSKMDPVAQLLDASGNVLFHADDDEIGPECRFSHRFAQAGDYWLELRDSRFAAGGAYHLRIGDFPILSHPRPLAIRRGEQASVSFAGPDGPLVSARNIQVPSQYAGDSMTFSARVKDGRSSAWVTLLTPNSPQYVEPEAGELKDQAPVRALDIPVGVSGQLSAPRQRDSFHLRGTKGQLVRVSSRTRSLGCPTLLQMQLFNSAKSKVAESQVTDADEWSFDYKFAEDGDYRLEVGDLLHRGGEEFGYWIEVVPAGSVSVAVKADAKAKELFAIEQERGVCVVDLQIDRFGYDGELIVSLEDGSSGLRILEPLIPAKAKDAKVYLTADAGWKPESFSLVRLRVQAKDNPAITCSVGSQALHRIKEPHVLFPNSWNDGVVLLAGVPKGEALFAFEPAAPVKFARPVKSHTATLNLKRVLADFKANVTILGNSLPSGWSVTTKVDKDVYTATFARGAKNSDQPEQLPLLVMAEHKDRARIETIQLPVEWIDPLHIKIEKMATVVAGKPLAVHVSIEREGNDPQPVILKFANLPTGITGPDKPVTVAADQTRAKIDLQVAPDIVAIKDAVVQLEAASKYGGGDFTVATKSESLSIIERPARLEAYPTEIVLDGPKSRQQIVLTGFDKFAAPRDWTRDARITLTNGEVAEVRDSVVFPVANGSTELVVELGGLRHTIPVRVANWEKAYPTAFESQVLVALSKQGCNSGACHGSPSGKGSFRLSLRAFDKQFDELTLIREDFMRRVNPLEPEQSLLLSKPLMLVSHGGGKQLRKDDAAYAILRDWIAEGGKADSPGAPRVTRLAVVPSQKRVLNRAAGAQQLAVTAHYSDGSQRDVTHLAAYESSNTSVGVINKHGLVTAQDRGETAILVRFLEHIESLPLMFVEDVPGFEWKSPPPRNYVDELVNAKLRQLQYLPSETCSDSEFLRRVYLDVIGILPTIDETKEFLADAGSDKRSRLIDRLLERDEYAKFWALKWGDLLKMTSKMVGDDGVYKYYLWVEEAIRKNMPYDQFARQLLTGAGSTLANPPANFYRTAADTNDCVETISQLFLGARLQCAKCHNHPFERWTQDNYYGLSSFFNRVQRKKSQRPGELVVWTSSSGDVTQPRTGQVMKPWLPQVGSLASEGDQDRREAFASWLVDPKNPYFAKIEVNRIWSQLFSKGIVDPVDDFRDSNPPSNEALLDALAKDFIASGFDRKRPLRVILNSRTYQAGYQTNKFNEKDTRYFSHQEPRMLSAEQLLDAVNMTTGLSQTFGSLPVGTKATQLPAPDLVKVDFLKVFGQPERSTVCACERADESNLGMAIELLNGPLIHEKLRDANNRFRKSLTAGRTIEETINELYLAAVCRQPTPVELRASLRHCESRPDKAAALEDVCWALLNTDEFLFQH